MKKTLSKIAFAALAAFFAASFTGCPNPNGPDKPSKDAIWEDATLVEELAGKEISWGKDKDGTEINCIVPLSYTKRLQEGSKIVFEVAYNEIASDYIEIHAEDGAWGAIGVKDYYTAKDFKLTSEEETNDDGTPNGRFKVKVEPGTYYFVATKDVLDTLKAGFGFNGNFKLVRVGITNLAEEVELPPAEDGEVVYEAEGDALNINVASNKYDAQDGQGDIVRGIQFSKPGATYLPAGAVAGDVYEINLAGKADAEFSARVQFLDANWGGIVSPAEEGVTEIPLTTFTTADFDIKLQVKFTTKTEDGFKFVIGKDEIGAESRTLSLKKFTITKISSGSAETVDPDAEIELTEPADKDGYYTFWAQSSGAAKGSVMLVLNYESETYNTAVTLKDVEITYIINDGDAQKYTAATVSVPKNAYGTDYQAKVPVFADYKVTKNDAIYVKISAKTDDKNVVGEDGVSIIQGNLIDTDPSANYWKELCIEEQQKQLLKGITYEESSSGDPDPDPAPTVEPITYNTARKSYTLTTNDKDVTADDVGLTLQYFVADGEDPVSITVTNLKVSVKVGEAEPVVRTFDTVTIEHHDWDSNAAESNARINLTLGTADETIASGTTVVLQVLEATVSDKSLASGITFALQQDGKNGYDMLTVADSHPFADAE